MADQTVRTFEAPDRRQEFALGYVDLITLGALTVGYEVLEPGWRWSTHVKPIVGTERCEHHHVGYQVSGRWVAEARDGSQVEIGPGEVYDIPAGHDAWIVGDEPSIAITFQGSADYAAPKGTGERLLTTLLFTDIVGSTALAAQLGDERWSRVLRTHLEDVHVLLSEYRGDLVDTTGDGLLARFQSPADALRCGLELVRAARAQGFEVRIGVHTAEVELADGDVRGVGVHLAARVMAAAGAGQVLATGTTREIVVGAEFQFAEAGDFELKGIEGARTLYAVSIRA